MSHKLIKQIKNMYVDDEEVLQSVLPLECSLLESLERTLPFCYWLETVAQLHFGPQQLLEHLWPQRFVISDCVWHPQSVALFKAHLLFHPRRECIQVLWMWIYSNNYMPEWINTQLQSVLQLTPLLSYSLPEPIESKLESELVTQIWDVKWLVQVCSLISTRALEVYPQISDLIVKYLQLLGVSCVQNVPEVCYTPRVYSLK